MNFKEAEQKVKDYYNRLRKIEQLKYTLSRIQKAKTDIQNKIDNSLIELNDKFMAVKYGEITGKSGVKTSPQEKAVDKAFSVLEKRLRDINSEILFIEEQIECIEIQNSEMDFILKNLKPEYKEIMDSLYRYKKNTLNTAIKYNMDKSTVSRKKNKVIKEVMRWSNFL